MISKWKLVSPLESVVVYFSSIQVGEYIKVCDTITPKENKIVSLIDISLIIELNYVIRKIIYVTDISFLVRGRYCLFLFETVCMLILLLLGFPNLFIQIC